MLTAKEFERLLPWYLNGSLSDAERAQVHSYLETHPEEQTRVRWNESLRGAIHSRIDELPEDLGLQRALSAIRPDAAATSIPRHAGRSAATSIGTGAQQIAETAIGAHPGSVTELLGRVNEGDNAARDALFALAYGELRKLAHVRLYQSGRGDMLDTTALVHETYVRFLQSSELRSEDRRSFFAFASQAMRNVIVETARARLAQHRSGGANKLTLSAQLLDDLSRGEESILEVHEALLVLEEAEPRLARLVEMRYYGGYTEAEIAETLGVTERTVQRDWKKACLLLKAALARD
jgi:RNA polymerase sigma factor (TIGR02999 family)